MNDTKTANAPNLYKDHRQKKWCIHDEDNKEVGVIYKSKMEVNWDSLLIIYTPNTMAIVEKLMTKNPNTNNLLKVRKKLDLLRAKALAKARIICKAFNDQNIKP